MDDWSDKFSDDIKWFEGILKRLQQEETITLTHREMLTRVFGEWRVKGLEILNNDPFLDTPLRLMPGTPEFDSGLPEGQTDPLGTLYFYVRAPSADTIFYNPEMLDEMCNDPIMAFMRIIHEAFHPLQNRRLIHAGNFYGENDEVIRANVSRGLATEILLADITRRLFKGEVLDEYTAYELYKREYQSQFPRAPSITYEVFSEQINALFQEAQDKQVSVIEMTERRERAARGAFNNLEYGLQSPELECNLFMLTTLHYRKHGNMPLTRQHFVDMLQDVGVINQNPLLVQKEGVVQRPIDDERVTLLLPWWQSHPSSHYSRFETTYILNSILELYGNILEGLGDTKGQKRFGATHNNQLFVHISDHLDDGIPQHLGYETKWRDYLGEAIKLMDIEDLHYAIDYLDARVHGLKPHEAAEAGTTPQAVSRGAIARKMLIYELRERGAIPHMDMGRRARRRVRGRAAAAKANPQPE